MYMCIYIYLHMYFTVSYFVILENIVFSLMKVRLVFAQEPGSDLLVRPDQGWISQAGVTQ